MPRGKAYLGVWANPAGSSTDRSGSALQQAASLEQVTGFSPAILSVYTSFAAPAPVALLEEISQRGAIPLVSWACAPTSAVAAGDDDAVISNFAAQLRQFGRPVFVRWFWEMNLRTAPSNRCNAGGGPDTFVAAWKRVWNLFHRAGASNVALVWCPGINADPAGMAAYFPGAAYVDWIGADGYDHRHLGAAGFSQVFAAWYQDFQGYGKPMMVAETGAMPADQADYLAGIGTALPVAFPLVGAVVYFDARGPDGSWVLSGEGVRAFAALGREPYFTARG